MPVFQPNVPIETDVPTIAVQVNSGEALPPGRHTFRLVVVDNDGLQSEADTVDIIVKDTRKPTAVLDAPAQVLFGQDIALSGSRSSDPAPGKVVRYIWTLLN
jgi:hypothetical protein